MAPMKQIWAPAVAVVVLAAVAVFDVLTGWLLDAGVLALVIVVGLLVLAAALFGAEVWAGMRYRREPKADEVSAAASGLRWSTVFAIGWAVLLFANCSSGATSGAPLQGAMADPATFLFFTAVGFVPLLIGLAVPAILGTVAQVTRGRRWAGAAMWSIGIVALLAIGSSCGGFYGSFNTCGFGASPSACAAGIASLTNTLSLAALALFVPYLLALERAIKPPPIRIQTPP